jgi:hypothetical protein
MLKLPPAEAMINLGGSESARGNISPGLALPTTTSTSLLTLSSLRTDIPFKMIWRYAKMLPDAVLSICRGCFEVCSRSVHAYIETRICRAREHLLQLTAVILRMDVLC